MKLTEGNRNLLAACIIALGFVFASFIYAYSQRYEIVKYMRVDKWTGKANRIEFPKN
jgi:hypothetical protein